MFVYNFILSEISISEWTLSLKNTTQAGQKHAFCLFVMLPPHLLLLLNFSSPLAKQWGGMQWKVNDPAIQRTELVPFYQFLFWLLSIELQVYYFYHY